MAFAVQLKAGWRDHAGDPGGVWERRGALAEAATSAGDLTALAGLATHVAGEHLGRWAEGVAFLEGLRQHPAHAEDQPVAAALGRSIAALQQCAGEVEARAAAIAQAGGGAGDEARVEAVAAAAMAAHGRIEEAGAALERATELAAGLADDHPAVRAIAITGNNLASALEEQTDRSPAEVALMIRSATLARQYWARAGTWIHVERAEYRLAMTMLAAAQPRAALTHAEACRDACDAHDGDPFERIFSQEALARCLAANGDEEGASRALREADRLVPTIASDGDRLHANGVLDRLRATLSA